MGLMSYTIFTEKGPISMTGEDIDVPREYAGYPVIKAQDSVLTVYLSDMVLRNNYIVSMVRANIMQMISNLKKYGDVRLEFPVWDKMVMYAVVRDDDNKPYEDYEQMIDSFLELRGPEMIF